MMNVLLFGDEYDWDYEAEPDGNSCLGNEFGICKWHRGKVLGGTSVVNGMLYVRGHPEDYNAWERDGNYGWSYREVLQFFKKVINYCRYVHCTPI